MRVRVTISGHARSAVLALTLLGVSASAGWAEEGPFPVRLNPILELESVDPAAIDARLRGPLWPDSLDDPGIELFKVAPQLSYGLFKSFEERVIDRQVAGNCPALRALSEAGYEGRFRNNWQVQQALIRRCDAIEMLLDVREARVSYVREFTLSAEAPDVLPAMIDNSVPFDIFCDQYAANQASISWGAFDTIVKVEVRSPLMIRVWAERFVLNPGEDDQIIGGGLTAVRLLAWGDFTGEGTEDILVESISGPVDWIGLDRRLSFATASSVELFILTRSSHDEVLRVVGVERHLRSWQRNGEKCSPP